MALLCRGLILWLGLLFILFSGLLTLELSFCLFLAFLGRSIGTLCTFPAFRETGTGLGCHWLRHCIHWDADEEVVAAVTTATVEAELFAALQTRHRTLLNQPRAVLHFTNRGGEE